MRINPSFFLPRQSNATVSFPDRVRGIFNEGGLYGERAGWHLPGFNTSTWVSRDFSDGLPEGRAGLGFFVTTFQLHIPGGYDVPMTFVFDKQTLPYRALLFVNGWNFGKRVANLGYANFHIPESSGPTNCIRSGRNIVSLFRRVF